MRRTTVRFGKRGPKIGGLKRVSLATRVQGSRRVRSASHHLRCSAKTMCCSQFIVPMASGILERGIGRRPAGRAVGCAQAPQAGLPPRGLPSLTQNDPSPRTSATADPIGSSFTSYSDQALIPKCMQRVRPRVRRMETTISRSSSPSYGKTAFVDSDHTDDVVLAVEQGGNNCADERCALWQPCFR